jgi:hypothetical protein
VDLEQFVPPGAVNLIKCDIEGAEEEFLANYPQLLERTRYLAIEFHSHLCDVPRCKAMIESAGLRPLRLLKQVNQADGKQYTTELFHGE